MLYVHFKKIKMDVSSSKTSKQLIDERNDTDGSKNTDELMRIIKKRLAEEKRLGIKSSRNNSLTKNLDSDSKVIKSSEPDLLEQLKKLKEIYSNPSFHNIKINYTYQKAIDQVMQLNKMNAVKLSFDLPWGLFKLRLWVVIITPIYIIRRIKSYY